MKIVSPLREALAFHRRPAGVRLGRVVLLVALGAWPAARSAAQPDPLLPVKSATPRVVIALDVSSRMQRDPLGRYNDPLVYDRLNEPFETSLGVTASTAVRAYRRRYVGLQWLDPGGEPRAAAAAIEVVGDSDPAFEGFDGRTRLGRALCALRSVIQRNSPSARFGLVTTRRVELDVRQPAIITSSRPPAEQPTDTGTAGRWRAGIPSVTRPGASGDPAAPLVAADAPGSGAALLQLIERRPGSPGPLTPAGFDRPEADDAPVAQMLDDARTEAERLIGRDPGCCNTVVVLVTGGGDPSLGVRGLDERAARFLSVRGRRVPLHVVALAPTPAEAEQLRRAAAIAGGTFAEVPAERLERVAADAAVPEMTSALCLAVQHAFVPFATLNEPPTARQPAGPPGFFPGGATVVGTVELHNAVDAGGALLPDTRVLGRDGADVPQRSNVVLSSGFELPGFVGRVSAFRVYRPVQDDRRSTGYRFVADGTRLWTARTPPADQRNVFTILPGEGVVPFRVSSADRLAPLLGGDDPAAIIEAVRAAPLGAIISSTPALLEPPSQPLVDPDYLDFVRRQAGRRGVVFVGANDGMLHALDARTGVEVWAIVPYNLLPKLRRLSLGAGVDDFPYFVDASPRLADVRTFGSWRTVLVFGEGQGGTFYQAFDVTLDGIADRVSADEDDVPALLAWFSDPGRIRFLWSYPRYQAFDPASGDLLPSATPLEKTVGTTSSTPVVGRAGGDNGPFVVIVGSGSLARSRELLPSRGGVRAGTRMYLVDVETGAVVDSRDVGTDGIGEDRDACADPGCPGLKNALHADPLAARDTAGGAITRVYQGDLDGRVWRFDLAPPGPGPPAFAGAPRLLLDAGSDQPIVGGIARLAGSLGQTYLFLGTGSDMLPRFGRAPGYRLFGLAESQAAATRQFERLLRAAALDGAEEGLAGAPVIGGSVVFFATTARTAGGCDPAEASLYAMTVSGGAAYDANGDLRRDARDEPLVARVRLGRSAAPVVADRHVFLATGDRVQVVGDPEGFASGPGFVGIRPVTWRPLR